MLPSPLITPESVDNFAKSIPKGTANVLIAGVSLMLPDMPRTHGYSKIGERCFGTHDWGAKGRTNAIGALLGTSLLTLAILIQMPFLFGYSKTCYRNFPLKVFWLWIMLHSIKANLCKRRSRLQAIPWNIFLPIPLT